MISLDNSTQPLQGGDHTFLPQRTETATVAMALSRGHHIYVSSIALPKRDPLAIKVRSDLLTSRIVWGLLDQNNYSKNPTHNLAEYTQYLSKGKGMVSITFSSRGEESWNDILASLQLLGDELIDTFLVLLAVALDTNVKGYITKPFTITPEDILLICQKKKSHGSYTARQRQIVLGHIQTLTRASVRATLMFERGKPQMVESSLLELVMNEEVESNETRKEYKRGQSWQLKIGNWASMVPELQSQTMLMTRQVLRYHAKEQKHEKRLGRYLTLLYRINAHKNEGQVKVSMGVLLDQSGVVLDYDNPGRTRDAIESALKRLSADGVIGTFGLLMGNSIENREIQERIQQHAYHWWEDYRKQIWLFEPPEYLKEFYQTKKEEILRPSLRSRASATAASE